VFELYSHNHIYYDCQLIADVGCWHKFGNKRIKYIASAPLKPQHYSQCQIKLLEAPTHILIFFPHLDFFLK